MPGLRREAGKPQSAVVPPPGRVQLTQVAPAIETFGTHRIVFGSQPAVPPTDAALIVPISGAAWYSLLRKCVSELGEEHEAMTAIMGANAVKLYDL